MIYNIKLFILKAFLYLIFTSIGNNSLMGQENFPSYQLGLSKIKSNIKGESFDCAKTLETSKDQQDVIAFKDKPLFLYTTPDFSKWSKRKNLMEASAHLYQVDKSLFLIISIQINSINAKRSYGNIARNTQMKIYLDNGNHIYLENIERDKGKVNRSEEKTNYKCILPIDKSDRKLLQKNFITKIGIMWGEGYQEYEVHNLDLIQNQLQCLNNK